jgi:hypothetical protein
MSRYEPPSGNYSGAFSYPPPPPPPAEAKKRSGLGAAALVLGLLALMFGWIPIVGLAMVPPAMLAILLGVAGFVAAVVTGRTGKALPFIASTVGVFALLVPPAATTIFAVSMAPWVYTVGMDQVQIELEYDLKRQGIDSEQAERVSEEIGDALRSFAKPGKWREGIATVHRFELICEDYRRALMDLDEEDAEGRELAAARFRADLSRLADRQGVDLAEGDLELLTDVFGREQIRRVDNWRQYNRRVESQYYLDEDGVHIEWGTCPQGPGCESE